jgi:hypothetical protein
MLDKRPRFLLISPFKTAPYFNRPIPSRFPRVRQHLCCCDPLTLRSMGALRFVLMVAPATEVVFFLSNNSSSIVSLRRVVL